MPRLRFGLSYDFRNPPESGLAMPQLYAETLEQMVWAESLGFDQLWFTEHHFVEDGYLPSWVPVAGAVAARTERIRISQDICILPFRNPINLAEDLAVLDNLSNGRVELGVGMGYAPHEFRGFGFPVSRRLSLMEEGLAVLRRCFRGERFSFQGKRYTFSDVHIKPDYVQAGGPPLWVAAMARNGALRAARFDCHLLPQGPRAEVLEPWRDALSAAGRDPASYRVGIIRGVLVTDDPERDWPRIREAERTRMRVYKRFLCRERSARPPGHVPRRLDSADLDCGRCRDLRRAAERLHHRARPDRFCQLGGPARLTSPRDACQPGTPRPRGHPACAGQA